MNNKIRLSVLILLTLLFVGCTKEDSPPTNQSTLGNHIIIEVAYDGMVQLTLEALIERGLMANAFSADNVRLTQAGTAVPYALFNLEDRGVFFVKPGEDVYQGMILGEHNRENDLEVNPLKGKKLTNIRASGKDDAVVLTPATRMTLEQAIAYLADDELLEVTPHHLRLRKRILDPHERKRELRNANA